MDTTLATAQEHPLDNPVWHALCGPHRGFALQNGLAAHYPREMSVFSAIAEPSAQAYADLAQGLAPGSEARLVRHTVDPLPEGWEQLNAIPLLQMLAAHFDRQVVDGPAVTELGPQHLAAVTALIDLTQPGPFGPRTLEMGRFFGVFDEAGANGPAGSRLLAMAGERMNLPGYLEMSAICTHPDARGRGLGEYLLRQRMRDAVASGQQPFLHVLPSNAPAIALYERLGFEVRSEMHYIWRRPLPGNAGGSAR